MKTNNLFMPLFNERSFSEAKTFSMRFNKLNSSSYKSLKLSYFYCLLLCFNFIHADNNTSKNITESPAKASSSITANQVFQQPPATIAIAESSVPAKKLTTVVHKKTTDGIISNPGVVTLKSKPESTVVAFKPRTRSKKIITISKIVVFVNKGVITSTQVNAQVAQALQTLKQKGVTSFNQKDVRAKVIEQLIMQQIQLDLAARSGIKTTDIEVAEGINNMAKSQKMTPVAFKAHLTKQGVNYDEFRKQIQTQITMEKLKHREVDGRVSINEDEVNRVLASEAYKNRVDYNLSVIIIGLPEQSTNAIISQKQSLANQALANLKSGVSFNQVAIKYSNAPNALSGGELGWRSSATLPPMIASALANLPVGGYSSVIKLPVGFFIFKINSIKKHGMQQIVHQYHVRHILIKVNDTTSDSEAEQKIISIKAKLDKVASDPLKLNKEFVKLAKQNSEDTSSINGGEIGWVSKGDTVPAFEQVVLKIPIGQISKPIRSQFGWHILEVLGVRDSNLTNDREKAAIRQELHENKAALLYTQWLRDIREMAYVKMSDD
jgi:peptidyl-prolyl cis-trans isomerase SurA